MACILSSTEAMPQSCAVGKRTWNNGISRDDRDCTLGDRISLKVISLKVRASEIANVHRCWTRTRLWRRHRPRSEQAGILRYAGLEGGLYAFA